MALIDVGAKFKFDSTIFTQGFPKCCECDKCDSLCCEAGAIITLEERDKILAVKDEIIPLLKPDRQDPQMWFTPPDDDDFTRVGDEPTPEAKAKYVGTGIGHGMCNFFNPKFGCALQQWAVQKGLHKWAIKPNTCVLYPLFDDEQGVIKPDVNLDSGLWCADTKNHKSSVFNACQQEIEHVAGKEALEKLKAIEHEYVQKAGSTERKGKISLTLVPPKDV